MTIGLNPSNVPEPLELSIVEDSENGFYNYNGQTIGMVYESPTHDCQMYVSFKKKETHHMRMYNSYAIDTHVVEDLDAQWPEVEMVAIFVTDEGQILLFDLETYKNATEDNFQHGDQLFPEQTEAETVYNKIDFGDEFYPDHIEVE